MSIVLTKAGEHFTITAADQMGVAIQTGNWKTGAIMGHCSSITFKPKRGQMSFPAFQCATDEGGMFLEGLTAILMAGRPVNLGLTDEKGDGVRAVFYFPDEQTAHKRMRDALETMRLGDA